MKGSVLLPQVGGVSVEGPVYRELNSYIFLNLVDFTATAKKRSKNITYYMEDEKSKGNNSNKQTPTTGAGKQNNYRNR